MKPREDISMVINTRWNDND